MQLTFTGEPADLAAFCQAVGRQTEEPVTLYQTPKTVLDYIEAAKTNTSIPPIRKPPKERTAMLEAIFRDYLNAGMDAKTIKEHLAQEHDISMSGHQICGWLGRMRQKGCQRPKDAAKAELEGNCTPQEESAKEEPIEDPRWPGEVVTIKSDKSEDKASLKNLRWQTPILSSTDANIDRLNKDGKSSREISSILSGQGINLSWQQVRGRIAYMARKGHNSPKAEGKAPEEQLPAKEPDMPARAEPSPLTKRIIELDHQKMTPHTISDILEEENGAIVSEAEVMDIIIRNAKGML